MRHPKDYDKENVWVNWGCEKLKLAVYSAQFIIFSRKSLLFRECHSLNTEYSVLDV